MTAPDYGKAADDYARHRQGFPDRLFDELSELGIGRPGQQLLDLGTGTGLMARAMAQRGCVVTAVDPSAEMLAVAERSALDLDLRIVHRQASAEESGLSDASFDVITAATCWHWFDRPKVARECLRLLRPGGALVIAHQDWLGRPGNVIEATLETIYQWNRPPADRKWTFQYPDWLFDLTDAGFADYRLIGFPAMLTHTHEAWIGRIVASAQIGPALDDAQIAAFRDAFAKTLAARFPDPVGVEHRVFALVLTAPV